MRMWKKAVAVMITACVCFTTPAYAATQNKTNEVVTATVDNNTNADNTKDTTEVQNKKSTMSTLSVKSASSRTKKYLGTFKAYAYNGSGTTASGTKTTANRTVAVDPKVIPLGSKIMINGKIYTAEDTGGSIKGKKLDIYMPSYDDCMDWGVRNVKVYLIK